MPDRPNALFPPVTDTSPPSGLRRTLGFLWWLPLLIALIAGTAAYGITNQQANVYRAEALLLVPPQTGVPASNYVPLATNPTTLRAVIQALNLPLSVPELQQAVVTSAQGSALRVGVEADTALESQRRSQSLAAQIVLNSAALLPGLPTPTAVRQPALPVDPLRKDTARNAALAVLGGLAGGIALAALLAGRERAAHTGAPRFVDGTLVVGVLARDKVGAVLLRDPESVEAESCRHLQRSLTASWAAQPYRTLLVAGVSERSGATTTAVNLALAFGQASVATLLVDGNLRRPGVHRQLGLPNTHGLADLLTAATSSLEPRVVEHAGIWVMTSGVLPWIRVRCWLRRRPGAPCVP